MWSKTAPTKCGFYWLRYYSKKHDQMVLSVCEVDWIEVGDKKVYFVTSTSGARFHESIRERDGYKDAEFGSEIPLPYFG